MRLGAAFLLALAGATTVAWLVALMHEKGIRPVQGFVTPSNTLQLTWQNALLGRDAASPVSFQMEVWPSGRFAYRRDLSRLGAGEATNILVEDTLGNAAAGEWLVGRWWRDKYWAMQELNKGTA